MKRGFTGPRAVSLVGCMILIIAASATFNGESISSLDPPPQCAFNPSGFFYTKERLAAGFADFDHLTLWEQDDKRDDGPRPGVYNAQGEVFKFLKLKTMGGFEFTTASLNGISYSFTGEFHEVCVCEEAAHSLGGTTARGPEEVFAEGKLLKFDNGRNAAETSARFTYSPKPRELKDDINAVYPSGRTDLIYAVWQQDIKKVGALLARGAKVNIRDKRYRKTALQYAIEFGDAADRSKARKLVGMLVAAGADVNLKNEGGETVLMSAILLSFLDKDSKLFEMLLAAGADVNAKTNDGTTVLMLAASAAADAWNAWYTSKFSLDKVQTLLRAGARVNERNNDGDTALSMVMKRLNKYNQPYLTMADKNKANKLINLLKQAGAR